MTLLVPCHHRPKAPAILKRRRSCLYMAPRAPHVPGSMPSSNARARKMSLICALIVLMKSCRFWC